MHDGQPLDPGLGGHSLTPARPVLAIGVWILLFGLAWLVLAGPDPASWIIGAPAVAGAVWAKSRLSGRRLSGLSPWGAVHFLPYFLWQSLKGGLDVALRVVGPRVRVDPGYLDYQLRLLGPSARVFFLDVVNLLPGTLTADISGDRARIHALDKGSDPAQSLMHLEERVAALFGEVLPAARTAPP
ncbi:MAG: Na+/H+ antiporter subunit E [Chromatiaceae bacterium]